MRENCLEMNNFRLFSFGKQFSFHPIDRCLTILKDNITYWTTFESHWELERVKCCNWNKKGIRWDKETVQGGLLYSTLLSFSCRHHHFVLDENFSTFPPLIPYNLSIQLIMAEFSDRIYWHTDCIWVASGVVAELGAFESVSPTCSCLLSSTLLHFHMMGWKKRISNL